MLVQYQCMKARWRAMNLGDKNYKFMNLKTVAEPGF